MRNTVWDHLRNPQCQLCKLHETAQIVCLIGDGPHPADLMLVGEAPGEREDDPQGMRKPFQGRAGNLLNNVLETLEIPRNTIFISNAVHCRPPENKKPTPQEISTCSLKYLAREIRLVKPKLILAMGAIAGQGLLQEKITVSGFRNKVWKTKHPYTPEIPVIVTYHPAAALRDPELIDPLVKDFEWMKEVMKNGFEEETVRYRQISSIDEIEGLDRARWISLDLETDGFDPHLPKRDIISVQLSIREGEGFYLKWSPEVEEEIRRIAENSRIGKVGHNINKFDRNWLRKKKIRLRGKIYDTLIGIHLLDENFPDKSLDVVASEFTPLKAHKDELKQFRREHRDADFKDYPTDLMIRYGCGDADASLRLKNIFVPRLREEGLEPLFNMQMDAMKLFADVEWNGAKIDVPLIDELADIYEEKIKKLDRALKGLNSKSSKQVCHVLYDQWKLPAVGLPTRKSKWKPVANSAEKTLIKLMEEYSLEPHMELFIRRVLRSRELRTQLSTYVMGIGDYIREGDLVHTNYLLHGAETGRLSSRNPNLQNIPRGGDIKRLFISRYGKRGVILSLDVSQGELRIAAHRSQDQGLLEAFRSGSVDIHRKVASDVLKIPEDQVTKEQRKKAKVVNFGILYGGGVSKMAFEMKTSEKEAYHFIKMWKGRYPGWEEYVRKVHREVLSKGYVTSDFGRRRRITITNPETPQGKEALRQAVNSPIQGGLSDLTVLCGIQLWEKIKRAKIKRAKFIMEVHDQWVIDTVEEHVEEIAQLGYETFRHPDTSSFGFEFTVPLDVEISVGKNWAEVEPINEEALLM